mgnify:CR=1 FL=1
MKMRPIQNEYLRQKEHLDRIAIAGQRKNELLNRQLDFIPPIPDMKDAYRQVRKSNASIPRSVVNATTGKPYK